MSDLDKLKAELDLAKKALTACRRACLGMEITSAEFAAMCGISRTQLSTLTGTIPNTHPDFIERGSK